MNRGYALYEIVSWIVGAVVALVASINFLYSTFRTEIKAKDSEDRMWQKLDKIDDKLDRVLEK